MLFTELGIVTFVKPEQLENVDSPMLITVHVLPLYVKFAGIFIFPEYLESP